MTQSALVNTLDLTAMFLEATITFVINLWDLRGFKTDTRVSRWVSLRHINHILDWRTASLLLTCRPKPSAWLLSSWRTTNCSDGRLFKWCRGEELLTRVQRERDKWRQTNLSDSAHCSGCQSLMDNNIITLFIILAWTWTHSADIYAGWPRWAWRSQIRVDDFHWGANKVKTRIFLVYFCSLITLKSLCFDSLDDNCPFKVILMAFLFMFWKNWSIPSVYFFVNSFFSPQMQGIYLSMHSPYNTLNFKCSLVFLHNSTASW